MHWGPEICVGQPNRGVGIQSSMDYLNEQSCIQHDLMSSQNCFLRFTTTILQKKSKQRMSERMQRKGTTKDLIQSVIMRKILLLLKLFEPRNLRLCLSVSVSLGREEPRRHPTVLSNWTILVRFFYLIIAHLLEESSAWWRLSRHVPRRSTQDNDYRMYSI